MCVTVMLLQAYKYLNHTFILSGYSDNMNILTKATGLCGIIFLKCFCFVLLLVQLGEGMPEPPSNLLPSDGKKDECYSVLFTIIDRCSTVFSLSGQGDS